MILVAYLLGVCLCLGIGILNIWNEMMYKRQGLPSGTMGWPLFGETAQFLKHGPNLLKQRRQRYGSVFKSHVYGCPVVISMDPELNRHILMSEKRGLIPGYPQSMLDILGRRNIAAVKGPAHKLIRGNLLTLIGSQMLAQKLLHRIDRFLDNFLQNWDGKIIDVREKTDQMAFFMSFKQVFDMELGSFSMKLKHEFDKLVIGTLSLPINLPGTKYQQGLQARKNIIKMLKGMMERRRGSSEQHDDMLNQLLNSEDSKYDLNDEEMNDQIITILNSGYETVSPTTMMAIKYLHDNPKALEALREEHISIGVKKSRVDPNPIDYWNDYKSMTFTRAVILETSRLATIINGVLRKTTEDIVLNGFLIPKGWRVYVYTREINYDPLIYPEPFTFNPWRWLEDKSLENHNYCFLFGGGSRLCPGKELGIAQISLFLHHFVTRYRFEEFGSNEIHKFPRIEAPHGLHMKISKI